MYTYSKQYLVLFFCCGSHYTPPYTYHTLYIIQYVVYRHRHGGRHNYVIPTFFRTALPGTRYVLYTEYIVPFGGQIT